MRRYIQGKYFLILIAISIISAIAVFMKEDISHTDSYGIVNICVLDTGKADAVLIISENSVIMIDTGENKHGQKIVDFLVSRDITRMDYLIITHFDKDHVGGASTVINNIEVAEVIVPNYGRDSKHYNKFMEAMADKELESIVLEEPLNLMFDCEMITIYPSNQDYYDFGNNKADEGAKVKENDFSIAVSMNHGNNNFLFTGDAETKRLQELLSIDGIKNTKYDFLKVPHHGRYNKFGMTFISAVQPNHAVITCSSDMPADSRVVAALEAVGTEVYFTTQGNIHIESNGNELIITYQ